MNYVTSNIWEIVTVHQQNKMLRNEVEQLRIQNLHASEYDAENQRLRALLGYKQTATQFDLVAARVIGRESATWSSVIEINRGTRDGVDVDMAVVTDKGLVGHVIEALQRLDEHVLKLADCLADKASVADIPAMTEQIDRLFESYVMQSQRDEHARHSATPGPAATAGGSGPAVELF